MKQELLQAQALHKRYGTREAVRGISLTVGAGEVLGLLGPNGAGKSSTIAMLAGLSRPDGGSVTVGGAALSQDEFAYKRRIGLVPQELALFEDLPALANIELFGALYELPAAQLKARALAVLAQVGLAERAQDKPISFSGGMKRRLNIACALVHEPDVLLLDEPTAGVDPQSRNAIFEQLEALKRAGKALIYTTHYMEEVERLADRVIIMDHGQQVAHGSLAELYRLLPAAETLKLELDREVDGASGGHAARPARRAAVAGARQPAADWPERAGRRQCGRAGRLGRGRAQGTPHQLGPGQFGRCLPRPDRTPAARLNSKPPLPPQKSIETAAMNAFLALVRKDLYLHFSNRRAVLMSIIAPILIAAFFGSLFGSKSGGSKANPVPIAISDQDHSPLTAKISAALQADPSLAVQSLDADAALAQVKAGKLRAAIVLPAGFGEQAGRALFAGPEGKRPEITLHYDPSQAMVLPMVRGLLAQHVMQLVSADTFSGQGAPVMKDMRAQVADNTALPAEQRQELTAMFDSIARVQERSARAPQAGASFPASSSFSG